MFLEIKHLKKCISNLSKPYFETYSLDISLSIFQIQVVLITLELSKNTFNIIISIVINTPLLSISSLFLYFETTKYVFFRMLVLAYFYNTNMVQNIKDACLQFQKFL